MAYTVFINYKNRITAVLNVSFGGDGSVYLIDLLSPYLSKPEYEITTLDFPVNKVGMGAIVTPDETRYYANSRLKFSHHVSGFFQISGVKQGTIISGIDSKTGMPRGVAVDSFSLNTTTNDGGPFLSAFFWGLNNIPSYQSKNSEPLFFNDDDINYQSMNNKGTKPGFVLLFFHIPITNLSEEQIKNKQLYYDYKNFKKPLLLKLLKDTSEDHGYIVGISCMKSRSTMESQFGFTLSGGAGRIDPKTGTCKTVAVIFPRPTYKVDLSHYSLNYL